ncbi:MAG: DUF3159 domain-containing protein [Nocardia sp.]|nr:DUF3159 domain-containing protein [Nocardia sp.]
MAAERWGRTRGAGPGVMRARARLREWVTAPEFTVSGRGGVRGLFDAISPHLVYLVGFVATEDVTVAVWSALGWSGALLVWRAIRRRPIRQALTGMLLVGLSALIVLTSGRGVDFYLPHILRSMGVGLVLLASLLVGRPLVGVIVGPVIDGSHWRADTAMLRAYRWCTAVWAVAVICRTAVSLSLYFVDNVLALGLAHLVLGIPLFAGVVYVDLRILRRAYAVRRARPRPER